MEILTARSLANRAIPLVIPRLAPVQHPQRGQHPLLKILRNQKVTMPRPEWHLNPWQPLRRHWHHGTCRQQETGA